MSSPGTGWLPALDGVRALAVLAVVAFHVDPALVPSGSLGVEVFFVLSGFLITRLLLAEHARTGTVRLRGFYARRLRRLVPALVLLVLAQTVVLGVHGRLSGAYAAAAARALSYTDDLFLGYGGTRGPFALTWSLSIEEQFYLLWPAALLALLARLRRSGRPGGRPLVPALARLVALAVAVHLLVAHAGTRDGWLTRVLATAPARWVGRRSYSCYLLHLLVLGELTWLRPLGVRLAAVTAVALLAADLGYRWVEQPFLRRRGSAGALDLPGLEAAGAHLELLDRPGGDLGAHRLDVGVPAATGPAVRAADAHAEAGPLGADVADGSHGGTLLNVWGTGRCSS